MNVILIQVWDDFHLDLEYVFLTSVPVETLLEEFFDNRLIQVWKVSYSNSSREKLVGEYLNPLEGKLYAKDFPVGYKTESSLAYTLPDETKVYHSWAVVQLLEKDYYSNRPPQYLWETFLRKHPDVVEVVPEQFVYQE